MPSKIAVVCEARDDFQTATDLVDRVIVEEVDWISADLLDDFRQWQGVDDATPYVLWRDVHKLAKQRDIRIRGHFDNQPGMADSKICRLALNLLWAVHKDLEAILLIRDDDRQKERRKGLEQARNEFKTPLPVVIGLAHLKRECWVLLGFDPETDNEKSRLEALIQELSFDPCHSPERLADKKDHENRSAKRVLKELTCDNREREERCWQETALDVLAKRGQEIGLTDYLTELKTKLIPIFTGR